MRARSSHLGIPSDLQSLAQTSWVKRSSPNNLRIVGPLRSWYLSVYKHAARLAGNAANVLRLSASRDHGPTLRYRLSE